MYGLPKIHKEGAPVRPIISAIGTYNYKLAKYLDRILKPLTTNSNYIIKDTFDFVNRVSKLQTNVNQRVVSFDVESLFTNIPTEETINIILNRAFKDSDEFHGMKRNTLQKLLTICTQESHFKFNGKYYDQIDGVAMGSPLGPFFANIFMDEFENSHMETLKELGVITWMRYVDDVFSVVRDETCSQNILNYLNSQHNNIKFTIENEKQNKIPFLDTKVTRKETNFTTSIYHKPTFTGVYLNWTSLTSRKYKISLIYCLCDRIWKICQDQTERDLEFKKLKLTLAKNEYPGQIFNKEMDKFIKNRTIREQQTHASEKPIAQQQTVEKQKRYIVLPYSNHKVDAYAERLTKLVNETFNQIELKVAFKAPNEIGKLFPFKDNIKEKHAQSLVMYRLTCETCKQTYIGKTERILAHRIKEHLNPKKDSAIQTHLQENPTHVFDPENIEILDKATSNFKIRLTSLNSIANMQLHTKENTIKICSSPT
jgi:hypothetical protein